MPCGSTIGDGATVKVTVDMAPSWFLTHFQNLIIAIGREIKTEKDRNIRKRMNEYVMTVKVDFKLEEPTAAVFGINLQS